MDMPDRRRTVRIGLLCAAVLVMVFTDTGSAVAAEPTAFLTLDWTWRDAGRHAGCRGVEILDWDGDGTPEVFVADESGVNAYNVTDGALHEVWAGELELDPEDETCQLGDFWGLDDITAAPGVELWTMQRDGTVRVFSPMSFTPTVVGRVPAEDGVYVRQVLLTEPDASGTRHFVTCWSARAGTVVQAYELPSLRFVWRGPASEHVQFARGSGQLDTDPGTEVVFSSGHVIDASTGELEWTYVDPFRKARVANMDGDAGLEIVAAPSNRSLVVMDMALGGVERTLVQDTGAIVQAIELADVNADGRADVLTRLSYPMRLVAWDGSTGAVLFTVDVEDQAELGFNVGDTGMSGGIHVVWAAARDIHITKPGADAPSATLRGRRLRQQIALLQMDGDPAYEIVKFERPQPGRESATHTVIDSATGVVEMDLQLGAALPGGHDGLLDMGLLSADIDSDRYEELFIGTKTKLYLFDHDGTSIDSIAIENCVPWWFGDLDGDGMSELMVSETRSIQTRDPRDLAEVEVLARAPQMLEQLAVADVTGDGELDILYNDYIGPLQSLDIRGGAPAWPVVADSRVYAFDIGDVDGIDPPEVAAFDRIDSTTHLTVYDGPTQAALSRHDMPSTGERWIPHGLHLMDLEGGGSAALLLQMSRGVQVYRRATDARPAMIIPAKAGYVALTLDSSAGSQLWVSDEISVKRYVVAEPPRPAAARVYLPMLPHSVRSVLGATRR